MIKDSTCPKTEQSWRFSNWSRFLGQLCVWRQSAVTFISHKTAGHEWWYNNWPLSLWLLFFSTDDDLGFPLLILWKQNTFRVCCLFELLMGFYRLHCLIHLNKLVVWNWFNTLFFFFATMTVDCLFGRLIWRKLSPFRCSSLPQFFHDSSLPY